MKLLSIFIVSFLLVLPAQAQEIYKVNKNASSILIKGTSSLHDWESNVEDFNGAASFTIEEGVLTKLDSVSFSVVTESIKSGKRIMDNKTKDALDAKKHPFISFTLLSVEEITADSLTVSGTLNLAGVAQEISLSSAYQQGTDGTINISGVQNIDMEEYGVNPPSAMMGTMKTGKDVDVEFKITFSKN